MQAATTVTLRRAAIAAAFVFLPTCAFSQASRLPGGSGSGTAIPGAYVQSFNGRTAAVIPRSGDYTTSLVTESGSLYFTNPRVWAALSATSPIVFNSANGNFSCPSCGTGDGGSSTVTPITFVDQVILAGAIDGSNLIFTIPSAPDGNSLHVYRNGILQLNGGDYTATGTTITFFSASVPQPGDALVATYRFVGTISNPFAAESPVCTDSSKQLTTTGCLSSNPAWGSITGSLSGQADLVAALNDRLASTNNLSDLLNAATARSNLGLAAVAASGSATDLGTGTLAAARMATMVGDSGSGGTQGAVPAPSAGDAAAGKFLSAAGTWDLPSGGGGGGTATIASDGVTGNITNNGSRVIIYSATVPSIPAGGCLTITATIAAPVSTTIFRFYVDSTVVATPYAGLSSQVAQFSGMYCNTTAQSAQQFTYTGPLFYANVGSFPFNSIGSNVDTLGYTTTAIDTSVSHVYSIGTTAASGDTVGISWRLGN